MYTPLQVCAILQREENYASALKGSRGKGHVRLVKDAMITEGLVPIKITQLNGVYANWKKDGKCQLFWGNRGSPEIMPLSDLVAKFEEQQSRTAQLWLKNDTKQALYEVKLAISTKKGLAPETVKQPDTQTVNAYHSALMSHENVTVRKGRLS